MTERQTILFLALVLGTSALTGGPSARLSAHDAPVAAPARTHDLRPLAFEANAGQVDTQVRFVARTAGYSLLLTEQEAVLARGQDVVRLRFPGSSARTRLVPVEPVPGTTNYLVGADPARWKTGIVSYARLRYENLYPGIDLVLYGTDRQLEYDLVVSPGVDPTVVRMTLDGARDLRITPDGDLVGRTRAGEIRFRKPAIHQTSDEGAIRPVEGRYRIARGRVVAFDVDSYDRTRPLVIDPVVVYSTYLGGSDKDFTFGLGGAGGGRTIAVDATGAAYVTGTTYSLDFPTTPGSFQPEAGTGVFVTKIAPDGAGLVYSTYIRGTDGGEFGHGIAVDEAGNAYVVGDVVSSDFPASQTPFAPWRDRNMFLLKLDPTGSTLVYSVLFGAGEDTVTAVAVDESGNAYVTGRTGGSISVTNMVTAGAFQSECHCPGRFSDAFVVKFNATADAVVYGTYLGGGARDEGASIAVNAHGEAYAAGRTGGDFPLMNAAQPTFGGGLYDAFISKLSADGSSLLFSTYLGGSEAESRDSLAGSVAIDPAGNAYVTGYTDSGDFPRTPGAFQVDPGPGPGRRAYAAKYRPDGQLWYATFLAGNGGSIGTAVAADVLGRAYLAGGTESTNFPTTVDATQPSIGCGAYCASDAYVTVLDPSGSTAGFSTYLGGADHNYATGIALGPHGGIYVAGQTEGLGGFPTTAGAVQPDYGGGDSDVFVTRIDIRAPDTTPPEIGEVADIVAEATSAAGAAVTFTLPRATDNTDPAPIVSTDAASGATFPLGTTTVTVTATDSSGNSSTKRFTITVVDTTPPDIAAPAANPDMLWPPNHQMVTVTVTPTVRDAVDAAVACRIASISSNEPISGLGDGDMAPDWQNPTGLTTALRAERAGAGTGRRYTLTVACTDNAGNTARRNVTVTAPHDQQR